MPSPPRLRRRLLAALALVPLVALLPTGGQAAPPREAPAAIDGVALDVHDGDSFVLRTADGRRLRVRIVGIDAPERGQPWGDAARRALRRSLEVPRVRIEPIGADRYGRTIARVTVPGDGDAAARDVGLAMVRDGFAWHFARYASDQPGEDAAAYAAAQREARERRAGLWHERDPEPPWAFRSRSRRGEARPAAPGRSPPPDRAG